MSPAEAVLVVPRGSVVPGRGWRGIRPADLTQVLATVAREGRFAPRAAMELDPAFKQIIPYLVLRDGERYFLMHRSRAGGDARLYEKASIGVGGHLEPGDRDLAGGLAREWREELVADFDPEPRFIGLLNDDRTGVGRVHLGVVFVADARGRPVAVRETDKLSGAFAAPAEVRAVGDRLETWSQLVFEWVERPAGTPR
jgi:predicted NUDIX family phosphoesterase